MKQPKHHHFSKFKYLATSLFLLLFSFYNPHAQTTITIGLGSSTATSSSSSDGDGGPIYRSSSSSNIVYSRYHYLYTAAELGFAGIPTGTLITSLAWNKGLAAGTNSTCTFQIWMKNSSLTNVGAGGQNWATLIGASTQVFNSNTFTIPIPAGYLIVPITPFIYTGGALEISTNFNISNGVNPWTTAGFAFSKDNSLYTTLSYAGSSPPSTTLPTLRTVRSQIQMTCIFPPACSTPPLPGIAITDQTSICQYGPATLDVTGQSTGTGQTYQWESSTSSGGVFTPIGSPSSSPALIISPINTLYYRCKVTCGGSTLPSSEVLVTVRSLFPGGTYTINKTLSTGGNNFASFGDAINAISCGIAGPLIFDIASGTGPYDEQVTIPKIIGASATNTITFNGYNDTLTYNATGSFYHTLGLSDADYIHINDLNIVGTNSNHALVCHLWNNAEYNIFTNCTFTAPINGTNPTQSPFSCSGTAISAIASGASGSYNELINCTTNNGYYGVAFAGNTSGSNTGNKILNSNLRDAYFYASYNVYSNGVIISGNTISRPFRTVVTTSFYGVYMGTSCLNMLVEKNIFRNTWAAVPTSTGTQFTIHQAASASLGNENKVYNNLISNINFNGTIYGISAPSYNYLKVYHNTISLDQTGASGVTPTYGIFTTGTQGIDIRNNIVTISRGGTGVKYCVQLGSASGVICNKNDLYVNSVSGTNCVGFYLTGFATLASWKATNSNAWDQQSLSVDPGYNNTYLYNYAPTNILLNNVGANLGITSDINNVTRSITPDIGCYEFTASPYDVGVLSIAAPGTDGCYSTAEIVKVTIINYGASMINFTSNPITVTCNVTGATTTTLIGSPIGSLSPGATMDVTVGSFLNMTTNGTYSFNAYTTLAGDIIISNDTLASPVTRLVGPIGGTITSSSQTICANVSPILTLVGNYGGVIQWQKSTVSVLGPWVNVGAGLSTFSPDPLTQATYFRVVVSCNGNISSSNTLTINVTNPTILSTTSASRCNIGNLSLAATSTSGADIKWYSNSTGGSSLYTGSPFSTPIINNTTTFYAEANISSGDGTKSPIQVTEMDLGTNDQLEIQNVSPDTVDVTGWKVVVSNSYTDINSVNANVQVLSGVLVPGELIKYTDALAGPNYWGSNILWNPGALPTVTGWAAILDNNNILKDIVFMNWPAANIAVANIIVGGTPLLIGLLWSGNGINITTVAATNSVSRQGSTDNNSSSDFAIIPFSLNATNPGMALPFNDFICSSVRVPVVATINPSPSITTTIADPILCQGGATTIAVTSANDPNYTYTWTSSIGGFTATGAGPHLVSPTNSTTYTVNAMDNTAGPNAGCANQATVSVITLPTLSAGTVTTSRSSYCVSGSPLLTVTGAQGGSLQWQSSTVSATGPWSNVGSGLNTYSPGMVSQTTYYQVAVNCETANLQSNLVTVEINNPTILNTTPGSRCDFGSVTLSATASGSGVPKWYANSSGGIALGSGNSFLTPAIASTTNFYVTANSGNGTTQISSNGVPTLNTSNQNGGLQFSLFQDVVLNSIQVYSTAAGTATVTLENSANVVLFVSSALPIIASNLSTPQTLSLGWAIPAGVGYHIKVANTGNALGYSTGVFPAPMGNGVGTITNGWFGVTTSALNYFVYNMNTSTGCEGTRTPVTATVIPPPAILVTPTTTTICLGQSTILSVTSLNDPNYTYTWNPGSLTGSSITISPLVSTVYTLTALDTTAGTNAGCGNIATVAVTVNPILVTLNPSISSDSVCPGANVNLISNAIAPGYVMNATSTASFIDISATGTDIVAPASLLDDSEHNISIPSFTLNGIEYTTARIGVNGLIVLGSTAGEVELTNATLPSTANTAGNVFLSPYWDNLDIQTGLTIKTQTIGNDFIIQFTNAAHNNFVMGRITFQVQLNLLSGSINYVYNDVTFEDVLYDAGINATIGIQFSASSALQYSFNTASLTTGQAISFTPNSAPVLWVGPNGFVSALTNPTLSSVTSLESGTYSVTATDSNGCATSSSVNLTVKPIVTSSTSQTLPCGGSYVWNGNTYTASGTYTYTSMGSNGCDSVATLDLTVALPCNTTLNLTAFIEGYWNGSSAMLPVLFNQGQPNTATECDYITVELRDLTTLVGTPSYTTTAMLNTNGTAIVVYPSAVTPSNYYIVIKHRNALQTWSANAFAFPATTSYNFTTAASQAYGSNQVEIAPGIFAFYSGDFTSDENIDGVDLAVVEIDATEFVFGYLYDISNTNYPGVIPTDITGDGNSDALDLPALEANSLNFIFSSHP